MVSIRKTKKVKRAVITEEDLKLLKEQEKVDTKKRRGEKKEKGKALLPLEMFADVIKLIKTYSKIRNRVPNNMITNSGFGGNNFLQPKSSRRLQFILLESELEKKHRDLNRSGKGIQRKDDDKQADFYTKEPVLKTYEWPRRSLVPADLGEDCSTDLILQQPGCSSPPLKLVSLQQPGSLSESNYLYKNDKQKEAGHYSPMEDGCPDEIAFIAPVQSSYNLRRRPNATKTGHQSEEDGDDSRDMNYSPRHDGFRSGIDLIAPVYSSYNLRRRGGGSKSGQYSEDGLDSPDMNYNSPTRDDSGWQTGIASIAPVQSSHNLRRRPNATSGHHSEDGDDSRDMNYNPRHDDFRSGVNFLVPVESSYNLRRRGGGSKSGRHSEDGDDQSNSG